jgi:outer membrane protein OmpA-like peptidoglycan-associated protein
VAAYLIDRGVDAARITSVGYGEGHPIDSNDTVQGRSLNRRVDLLLKAKAR